MIRLLIVFIILFISTNAYAVTAWVDPDGEAAWGACQGAIKSGAAACSLSTANTYASAGDTVNMRTGTHTTAIIPINSGSSGSPITFIAYNEEVVTITGVQYGALLSSLNYITIDGLRFIDCTTSWITMGNGNPSYHTIQNCYMEGALGWPGNFIRGASHITYKDNTILGTCVDGVGGPADAIQLQNSEYILFEGNTITNSTHILSAIETKVEGNENRYVVYRNNRIENNWHSDLSLWRDTENCLVDNNIILNAGETAATNTCVPEATSNRGRDEHAGIQLNSSNNIVRRNLLVNNGCMTFGGQTGTFDCNDNRIYNNTWYKNYRDLRNASGIAMAGNIWKNNIHDSSIQYDLWVYDISGHGFFNCNFNGTVYYNIGTPSAWEGIVNTDPLFVSPTIINPTKGNFNLASGSPMIETGAFLTTTTSVITNSTTIPVNDARYFMDGWGIIDGDQIQFDGQDTLYTIASINYTTDTLTLTLPATVNNGVGVSLPFIGQRPDIGAYESDIGGGGAPDVTPPVITNTTMTLQLCAETGELSVTTVDEDATCKWGLADVAYASMGNTFGTTNLRDHIQVIDVDCDTSYGPYYVRCLDGESNANSSSTSISFDVEPAPDTGVNACIINGLTIKVGDKYLTIGGE